MYISRFQLRNYKSFREPAALDFTQGFNIISGQNNAGKTALLEALGLNFGGKPHRSIATVPARDTVPDQVSWAEVSFTLLPNEVKELMLASGPSGYRVAKPAPSSEFAKIHALSDNSPGANGRLLAGIFSQHLLTFKLRIRFTPSQNFGWDVAEGPSHGLYQPSSTSSYTYVQFTIDRNGQLTPVSEGNDANSSDMGVALAGQFQRHVYRFTAERMNIGRGAHGAGTQLSANAANLHEVLNQLQHNTSRFAAFNRIVNTILPQIKQISVRGTGPGQVEIVVWPHDPATQREDLAIPLSESGTGIGQVLAIVYVVMTSDRPQVIIIDEPQSFLHPGAARKLIEFLKLNAQHQFIIATHSPTIISAADPKTITLVRYENTESRLQQLDAKLEKGIEATLAEVGVRLSDSFGADNILWVEGRTEEKCFRLIVERLLKLPLRGTEILGIRQTGDLQSRDAKKVFEIYRSLAEGASLLPPAIAFILDQECRDGNVKNELRHLSSGRVRFLPRRMYENYLLSPDAIAAVANGIPGFSEKPIDAQAVGDAIGARLGDWSLFCSNAGTIYPTFVDGARVLGEIFLEFSETRVSYEKVRHGLALTEWLIEHAPEELAEVSALLEEILGAGA